jgi:hypothetical protein
MRMKISEMYAEALTGPRFSPPLPCNATVSYFEQFQGSGGGMAWIWFSSGPTKIGSLAPPCRIKNS